MKNARLLREFVRSIILAEERTPAASMNQMAYAATLPTVDAREDKSDEKVFQKVKRFHGKEFECIPHDFWKKFTTSRSTKRKSKKKK
jgi:hypothetical protein